MHFCRYCMLRLVSIWCLYDILFYEFNKCTLKSPMNTYQRGRSSWVVILKIKPALLSLIGIVLFEKLSHPDRYSCARHTRLSATYWLNEFKSLKKDLRAICRSHMNTYLGRRSSQSLAKWLSVRLRTKWFWVRVQLLLSQYYSIIVAVHLIVSWDIHVDIIDSLASIWLSYIDNMFLIPSITF